MGGSIPVLLGRRDHRSSIMRIGTDELSGGRSRSAACNDIVDADLEIAMLGDVALALGSVEFTC